MSAEDHPVSKALLTGQEVKVLNILGAAWNEYLKLPQDHPSDNADFMYAINQARDKVLARPGRRQLNAIIKEQDT